MLEWLTWNLLVWVSRVWATRYMDQWTKFQFNTMYGKVYVGIERETPYPESFSDLVSKQISYPNTTNRF